MSGGNGGRRSSGYRAGRVVLLEKSRQRARRPRGLRGAPGAGSELAARGSAPRAAAILSATGTAFALRLPLPRPDSSGTGYSACVQARLTSL